MSLENLLQSHSATRLVGGSHVCAGCGEPVGGTMAAHQAGVLTAAGVTLPRIVTTVEELETLPSGTVALDAEDFVFRRQYGNWYYTGYEVPYTENDIELPATVLYKGAPK